MYHKTKKNYQAPQVDLLDCRVEKGFQGSTPEGTAFTGGQLDGLTDGNGTSGNSNALFT